MEKVFIVAPHFPPSALPSSQRVRLIVNHLSSFDLWPFIFTVAPKSIDDIPDEWMNHITGDNYTKIIVGCIDSKISKKFGFGDVGLRMSIPLFYLLIKNIIKEKPKVILFPVPGWFAMMLGPVIKWLTGVPYAIDIIDPWVYETTKKNLKIRVHQAIAKFFEGKILKRSSMVFAVSDGIIQDLKIRYDFLKDKKMVAVPYGVEISDYNNIKHIESKKDAFNIRYVGTISNSMLPIVESLFQSIDNVKRKCQKDINLVFTGTSYAGVGLAKPVLTELIDKYKMNSYVMENPDRVPYKMALEIGQNSDLLLLIGDTTMYYAASKLMGLIASQKPFIAFVLEGSFPSNFLKELDFQYKVDYKLSDLSSLEKVEELSNLINDLIQKNISFIPVDIQNPVFTNHTAYGMTKVFANNIKLI